jgi:hypothetical protein
MADVNQAKKVNLQTDSSHAAAAAKIESSSWT